MNTIRVTPPTPFDGWFMSEQVSTTIGYEVANIMSYDSITNELIFVTDDLPQAAIDAIPGAVAAYVHPVDTTKNLTDVALAGMGVEY